MSKYYSINGLKVRVSDHEANTALRGTSDIYLYVKSADNQLLSIVDQLENICDKRDLNIEDFNSILNEWADGTYSKDVFIGQVEDDEDNGTSGQVTELKTSFDNENRLKLKDYSLVNTIPGSKLRAEIKQLSEKTGVSQSFIKKHFNIR
ncbi:hypothetical protein HHL23_09615 [Chryseobacterium sp. RP-3-3]|uniref:Uncharacterized protein n=1 Tax=Chryseobacterium antibioticum TaxID=2728847 RepID=A0A7Y0AMI1_9FLAO|nr:hypothetical protein [Chryseobacterium antibioticum]NML70058.1 hypothetical protein [Chryseobacterium antibioticum]